MAVNKPYGVFAKEHHARILRERKEAKVAIEAKKQ